MNETTDYAKGFARACREGQRFVTRGGQFQSMVETQAAMVRRNARLVAKDEMSADDAAGYAAATTALKSQYVG